MRRFLLISILGAIGVGLTGCVGDSGGFGENIDPGNFAGYYSGTIPGGTLEMEFIQSSQANIASPHVGNMRPLEVAPGGGLGVFVIRQGGNVTAVGELITTSVDENSTTVDIEAENEGGDGGGFLIELNILRNNHNQITGFERTVGPAQGNLLGSGAIHLDRKNETITGPAKVQGVYQGTVSGSGISNTTVDGSLQLEWYNGWFGGIESELYTGQVFAAFIGGKVYVVTATSVNNGIAVKPQAVIVSWNGTFTGTVTPDEEGNPTIDGTFQRTSGTGPANGSFHIVRTGDLP